MSSRHTPRVTPIQAGTMRRLVQRKVPESSNMMKPRFHTPADDTAPPSVSPSSAGAPCAAREDAKKPGIAGVRSRIVDGNASASCRPPSRRSPASRSDCRSPPAPALSARQIESGAAADVFVSADQEWMDHSQTRASASTTSRGATSSANHLVLIAPRRQQHGDPQDRVPDFRWPRRWPATAGGRPATRTPCPWANTPAPRSPQARRLGVDRTEDSSAPRTSAARWCARVARRSAARHRLLHRCTRGSEGTRGRRASRTTRTPPITYPAAATQDARRNRRPACYTQIPGRRGRARNLGRSFGFVELTKERP